MFASITIAGCAALAWSGSVLGDGFYAKLDASGNWYETRVLLPARTLLSSS